MELLISGWQKHLLVTIYRVNRDILFMFKWENLRFNFRRLIRNAFIQDLLKLMDPRVIFACECAVQKQAFQGSVTTG